MTEYPLMDGQAPARTSLTPTTSVIKSYWRSQLRSSGVLQRIQAASSPKERVAAEGNPQTPSSASSDGLTVSSSRGASTLSARRTVSFCSAPSSARRRLHAAAQSAELCRAVDLRNRFGSLAKPLFQNYLLPQLEPHETCPTVTVVLDLDETLVSNRDANRSAAILRPYCLHVLNALRHMKGLEVVLWTASTKETASPVVEQLSESGTVFDEVIYRSDLWFTEPLHTKDLRLLGREMDRVLIVDNAANCCKLNPHNAVLAEDFHGVYHGEDATLVNVYYIIERVLKGCQRGESVRSTLHRLAEDGQLCCPLLLTLPDTWKHLPLREIAPLKIPPHGRFTRVYREPLSDSVMSYWTM
ncbi:putative TFIIF-stimulated CTD phosphatase [Trypanosoma grayi]|uniref:putative TFIIF-stimulated CTD phosphatase n=1 Tax=Trypanosoma grayi TaxID=71804 RepID=UPI0004F4023B|nr:putative TFIIF-stimulated CTD phosphatase [Trypanosoma grayi]KEG14342.1 putative TFIIF-stimulated CTD phosphatase [Trypanosoma grayi]